MAGYNQSDFAFTLNDWQPQLSAMTQHLQEKADLRAKEALAEKDKQQQRSNMLAKYVGDQFDNKDFMTGSAADPLISQRLAETKQKYADIIRKNPNVDYADLQFQMSKDIGDLNGYSSVIKNINAGIDAGTKEFDKSKGVDGDAIKKIALYNALYKVDPTTGKATMRTNVGDFDPNHDYVGDAIKQHPEKYLNEGQVMQSALKDYPQIGVGNTVQTDYAGRKRTTEYDGKLYPFQQVLRDANGKEIVDPNGRAQYGLRTKTVDINGKQLEVMDDDVYKSWTSNKANNAILIKDLNDFNAKKGGAPIEDGTPEADILKSHFLKERLKGIPAPDFKHKDKTTEDNFRAKMEAGIPLKLSMSAEDRDLLKQQKENQTLGNTDLGVWGSALGGDANTLEGLDTKVIDGKTYYNVLPKMNGFAVERKGADKIYADNIWVAPGDKHSIVEYADPATGDPKTTQVPIDKWRGYTKQRAGINGVSLSSANKIADTHVSKAGQYIGKQDTKVVAEQQAQADIANFQKKKEIDSKIANLESTGDLTSIQGIKLKDGSEITGSDERAGWQTGVFQMDPYYIELTTPEGKTKKVTFKSKDEMSQYIRNKTK